MRLTIKDHIRESRLFNERAAIALALAGLLMLLIIGRLVYLQVISHEHFATLSDVNRINIVAVPPKRGFIYDRNGVLLAQNLPSFSLEIIPEQVEDIDATVRALRELVTISDGDVRRFYKQLGQKRPFNSIPLRFHLDDQEIARFAVNRYRFPGVEIEARVIRDYPLGRLASHAVGYVGRINEDELRGLDMSNYSATRFIGKVGVEKYYEHLLHGEVGFKQVETNALGRTLRVLEQTPPTPGKNIYLTLDAELQSIAETELGDRRGAVVAIEPNTGDILAFASVPTYDPNLFVTGIDIQTYKELQGSIDKPLFNRALKGQYPPGSTLKPFLGLAGLENDKVRMNTASFCPGWFSLEGDDHRYRDWKEEGHGTTDLQKAIVESCDVYFYDLALTLGIDRIHDYLDRFRFGQPTGVDLTDEARGLLPSREWKRSARHQPWYPGETLITGIGQGYALVTPLQLAYATAVLANRGEHVRPHILRGVQSAGSATMERREPEHTGSVPVRDARNWENIVQSMEQVVHSIRGTAQGIGRGAEFRIAGKTGTAQVFGIEQEEEYVEEEVAARLRDHALFIGFSPPDNPRIALAVIVENAGSGAAVAAPIARRLIDHYMESEAS